MKFALPMIKEKILYFNEIKNLLSGLYILYNKNSAQIKHLAQLSKSLSHLKSKIGSELFDDANMEVTGSIITSQEDDFMRTLNGSEGASG
jgi:hypothetical protein